MMRAPARRSKIHRQFGSTCLAEPELTWSIHSYIWLRWPTVRSTLPVIYPRDLPPRSSRFLRSASAVSCHPADGAGRVTLTDSPRPGALKQVMLGEPNERCEIMSTECEDRDLGFVVAVT